MRFNGTAADAILSARFPRLGKPQATHVQRLYNRVVLQAKMPTKIGSLTVQVRIWPDETELAQLDVKP